MQHVNRKTLLAIAIAGLAISGQAQQEPAGQPGSINPDAGLAGERTGQQGSEQINPRQQQPQSQASAGISAPDAQGIVGKTIMSTSGESIGEVQEIVRSSSGEHFAVARIGGFLGVGEETRAIPLASLELDGQRNLVTRMSRDELERLAEFDPTEYTGTQAINARAPGDVAGEAGQPETRGEAGARTTFEDADQDGDGELSRSEAAGINALNFALADRDRNGSVSFEEAAPYL